MKTNDQTIKLAAEIIKRHDPDLWREIDAANWEVYTEIRGPREVKAQEFALGGTFSYDTFFIRTFINLKRILQHAVFSRLVGWKINFLDFVATIIVHEFMHAKLINAGDFDHKEYPAMYAGRDFAEKLPNGTGILSYIDEQLQNDLTDGKWKDVPA